MKTFCCFAKQNQGFCLCTVALLPHSLSKSYGLKLVTAIYRLDQSSNVTRCDLAYQGLSDDIVMSSTAYLALYKLNTCLQFTAYSIAIAVTCIRGETGLFGKSSSIALCNRERFDQFQQAGAPKSSVRALPCKRDQCLLDTCRTGGACRVGT